MVELFRNEDFVIYRSANNLTVPSRIIVWVDDQMFLDVVKRYEDRRHESAAKSQLLYLLLNDSLSPLVTRPDSMLILTTGESDQPGSYLLSESAPTGLTNPPEERDMRHWILMWINPLVRKAIQHLWEDGNGIKTEWILDLAGDPPVLPRFGPTAYSLVQAYDNHFVLLLSQFAGAYILRDRNDAIGIHKNELPHGLSGKISRKQNETGSCETCLSVTAGSYRDGQRAYNIVCEHLS